MSFKMEVNHDGDALSEVERGDFHYHTRLHREACAATCCVSGPRLAFAH